MFGSVGIPELVIIMVIALIIFGPRKLPELGKALGQTIKEFKRSSAGLMEQVEREVRDDRGIGGGSGEKASDRGDEDGGSDRLGEVQVKTG